MRGLLVIAALYALTGLLRHSPQSGGSGSWSGGSTPDPDATVRLSFNGTPAASLTDATVQLKFHIDKVTAKPTAATNNLGAAPADMPTAGNLPSGGGTGHLPLEVQRANEPEWVPGSGEPCPPDLASVPAGTSPELWVDLINGDGMQAPGRNNNCVDCSRAVEATWRGEGAMAAAMADPTAPGTSSARVQEWKGGDYSHPSYNEIDSTLQNLGPGSSAIITTQWTSGGSHTYNALNDGGINKFVDGQDNSVSEWPPINWSESVVGKNWVFFYDGDGNPA